MILKSVIIFSCLIGLAFGQTCSSVGNSDIDLPNIASNNGKSQSQCCTLCRDTPLCQAFAWNDYLGGTCWLKAGGSPVISKPGVNVGVMSGLPATPIVSFTEFSNAVTSNGYPAVSQAIYNVFAANIGLKATITTKQEAAMALTQYLWESDGLRAKREYRCAQNNCPNDYRTAGCDASGQYYYGRGYIQLTWCYNYRPASNDLFGDDRLVRDPDMVAREETVAWDTAFWFWRTVVHNYAGVQDGRFGASTNAINGAIECRGPNQDTARHRYEMYKKVRRAFNLQGDGDERGCYN